MNQTVGRRDQSESMGLENGLEALESSTEFNGPVESLDGHHCNDHFAQIYETRDEKFRAAVPFVRHGLERGERIMYVVDESTEAEVQAAMRDAGVDVDAALDSGALTFHTAQETYLRNESFDPDEMIEFYGETVAEATEEYEALRIVAEMTWLRDDDTSVDRFMEYEQKINELFEQTDSLAICQYNRESFAPAVIRNVVQTHPHLIYDGAACHNVYYTPPEEFFGEDAPARENERMLRTLRDRTEAKNELKRREEFLRESYETTSDPTLDFEEKLERLIDLGREWMGLDAGGLTHLPEWDGKFRNEYAVGYGDDAADESEVVWTDPGDGCYCRQTITADEPVGMADVRGTDWEDDQIHQEHGLTCYLGTKVTSGSTPYGTLWVGSTEPRDREFTKTERTFLELIGQWVSYEIERRQYNDAQRDLYEITSDPDLGFEEKLDALFDLGTEQFGLDIGGMAEVYREADQLEVEHVSDEHGDFKPGLEPPLSGTYCGAAFGADGPATVTDPVAEGYDDGYAYQELGFEAYLGTHIEVEGGRDRLFFFTTAEPRDGEFSKAERTFVELLGQWVKHELERQQRERELRERTEHLSALVETTPECIKTVAPDGTLLQMNPAGLDMVEAPAESAVTGENVYDLIAPEHRDRFREFNERICRGERGTLEFDIIGLDGTRRHMESHAAPLRRPDGTTAHVALTRDVTEQVEREAELQQSKNRFETVFEDCDDSIFIIDPDADEFADVNPAAAEMTGYTRDELLSQAPSDLHPDERDQFRAFLDEVRETGSAWSEDLHCRAKDGRDIPAEITASAITLDGRDLVLALVRDIEERKEHERYQRDLYEITAAPDLSFDGKLERLLELGRDRFGLEMGALNHLPSWDGKFRLEKGVGLGVDSDEELWTDPGEDCYCRQTITEADPVEKIDIRDTHWAEDAIYRKFGITSYLGTNVSIGAEPYGTLWFGSTEPRDQPFSESERSFIELMGQWISYEVERREHSESQRELYDITADPDLGTDEKISRMLEAGCERLNLSVGMLTRERERAFEIEHMSGTHPELGEGTLTPPSTGNYCRRVVDTGESISVSDVEAAGWDGDALYHEFDLQCYAGTQVTVRGEAYGTVCFADTASREEFTETERTFLDLLGQCVGYELERQQHESDLEKTIDQLEQSNDRLKQFAYAASHDLQEPLRMVSSYLQLLENQYRDDLDGDAQKYIDFAVDGADRMRAMVDDLLAYSRVEQADGEFEPVDCDALLERVTDDLQIRIEENDAAVAVDSLPTIVGDREQLEQLFNNLVSNAIKYNESDPPRVEITADRRADRWVFSVTDNGIGIDSDKTGRIFEVFKRLHHDDEYSGTGIGLSLCQEIVENHCGDIWVESEPGDGSTFSFTLPAAGDHDT